MNARRNKLPPPWNHWYRRALPAYWVFLFVSTHLPKLQLDVGVPNADKWAHLVAYGLLAFLLWRFAEAFRRPLSDRFVGIALLIIAAYGALDEALQPLVNRSGDFWDWVYDVVGAVLVLAPLELHRRWRLGRTPFRSTADRLDSPAPKR